MLNVISHDLLYPDWLQQQHRHLTYCRRSFFKQQNQLQHDTSGDPASRGVSDENVIDNNYERSAILARFGPSACPSTRPFVCPALLVPVRLVSHAPTAAASAVYFGPQLAACRLCLPRATVRPSKPRPVSYTHLTLPTIYSV